MSVAFLRHLYYNDIIIMIWRCVIMNMKHIQYLVEIERVRSISQAAENLYIGQPNLSRILREVEEEVGLDCQIVRPLTPTMHFHRAYGHWEIKRTHWFVMDYEGDKTPTPQQEEGINQVVWLCGTELFDKVVSTYSTIHSLFMEYFNTEAAIAMQEELLNEN